MTLNTYKQSRSHLSRPLKVLKYSPVQKKKNKYNNNKSI